MTQEAQLKPARIEWEECPCGHKSCKRAYPSNFGTFYSGSGFEPHEREWLDEAWNTRIESGVVAELVEALRAIDEAQQATDDAVEHHERAVAEGWRNDPTGSGHVSESNHRADKAWQRANDLRRNALAKLEPSK